MNNSRFWKYFAYIYLFVSTLSIVVLFETVVYGKPFVSLFFIIFALTLLWHWPEIEKAQKLAKSRKSQKQLPEISIKKVEIY